MTGTVKRVFHTRGFGFVVDETGAERFIHVGDFLDEREWPRLLSGQTVDFTPVVRPNKGLGAKKVKVVQ